MRAILQAIVEKCHNQKTDYNLSSRSPASYSADGEVAHNNENTSQQTLPQSWNQIYIQNPKQTHLEVVNLESKKFRNLDVLSIVQKNKLYVGPEHSVLKQTIIEFYEINE